MQLNPVSLCCPNRLTLVLCSNNTLPCWQANLQPYSHMFQQHSWLHSLPLALISLCHVRTTGTSQRLPRLDSRVDTSGEKRQQVK